MPIWGTIVSWAILKGFMMALFATALMSGDPFWHQLVLVAISAGTTCIGMIVAATITARRVEKPLQDLHRASGLTKRATDVTDVTGDGDSI